VPTRRIRVPLLGEWSWPVFQVATVAAPLVFIVAVWLYALSVPWPRSADLKAGLITLVSLVASVCFASVLLHAIEGAYAHLEKSLETVKAQNEQLEALHEASLAMAQDLDLRKVLTRVVDLSRTVIGARYAALRILDPTGPGDFLTSGISEEEARRLGPPPQGKGVLGVVATSPTPVRLRRIQDHPSSVGFPPGHPEMTTFLGAPVRFRDRVLGYIYLTEKVGRGEFTPGDEKTLERFAAHAGAVIANAQLLAEVRRLAEVEERERIGRELHDGTLQELYALALRLQAALLEEPQDPEHLRAAAEQAIDAIRTIMANIRRYVFHAGTAGEAKDLAEALRQAVGAMVAGPVPQLTWDLSLPADLMVAGSAVHDLVQVVREAVANSVRHGSPRHIQVVARLAQGWLELGVVDDGTGFDPQHLSHPGHGLANMEERARSLGGELRVQSAPSQGTRLTVRVPMERILAHPVRR
jgi:signal transduction histidine kinase